MLLSLSVEDGYDAAVRHAHNPAFERFRPGRG